MNGWDRRFLDLAELVATWSKDPTTKVGAVLVGRDRRDVAVGYNGFPRGVKDLPERLLDREVKHVLTQHAERNVLDNSRFDPTEGTLYVTKFPCTVFGCSKSIASKRLRRVVCPPPTDDEPWASDSRWTRVVLQESGVSLVEVDPVEEAGQATQLDLLGDCLVGLHGDDVRLMAGRLLLRAFKDLSWTIEGEGGL